MVLDFLEILSNSKQLYCKHLKLIILLRRPHSKNKETPLWVWAETATEIQATITKDLLNQKLLYLSFLKSLRKVLKLMYCHQAMIHNLTKPINSNM